MLKTKGRLGFITPETFIRTSTYSEIRSYLINNFNLVSINIYGIGVFENVTAETITMIIHKSYNENNKVYFYKHSTIEEYEKYIENQKDFLSTPEYRFVYGSNKSERKIFEKLKKNKTPLGSIVDVRNGIATKSGKKSFLSSKPLNNDYKKLLEAPDIFRYGYKWPGVYINYNKKLLHRPRKEETFLSPKIMIKRVSSRLICAYDCN